MLDAIGPIKMVAYCEDYVTRLRVGTYYVDDMGLLNRQYRPPNLLLHGTGIRMLGHRSLEQQRGPTPDSDYQTRCS